MTYYETVQRLNQLGINVPEIIINLPLAKDKDEENKFKAVVNAVLLSVKREKVRTVLRLSAYDGVSKLNTNGLSPDELEKYLPELDHSQISMCLFKAPKHSEIMHGLCVPGIHSNVFHFNGKKQSTVWGVQGKELPFPVGIRKPVIDINEALYIRRSELDGAAIEFTYHSGPVGMLENRALFWGYKQ